MQDKKWGLGWFISIWGDQSLEKYLDLGTVEYSGSIYRQRKERMTRLEIEDTGCGRKEWSCSLLHASSR